MAGTMTKQRTVQPRHPQGSPRGGQWISKSHAEMASSKPLKLADKNNDETLPPVKIKILGRQKTLKPVDGTYDLPYQLSSSFTRSFIHSHEERDATPAEAMTLATIVVTEMLAAGGVEPTDGAADSISKACVKGAYYLGYENYFRGFTSNKMFDKMAAWKKIEGSRYGIIELQASIRGMQLGDEFNVEGSVFVDKKAGKDLRTDFLIYRMEEHFKNLLPMRRYDNAARNQWHYLGEDGQAVQKLMEMRLPKITFGDKTVMGFIQELSEQPVKGTFGGGKVINMSETVTYVSLYLLGNTNPGDKLHNAAYRWLDNLLQTHNRDDVIKLVRSLVREGDTHDSTKRDEVKYKKVKSALMKLEASPS